MSSITKTNKNNQQLPKNTQLNTEKNSGDNTVASNLSKNITTENAPQIKELVPPNPPSNLTIVRQASFSSQDGKSKNTTKSQKSKVQKIRQKSPIPKQENSQSKIKENDKKGEEIAYDQYNVLKISGILDAYQHFLKLLCKHGLPTGKIYDYAAQQILKYQKKKINKELKMRAQLDIQKIIKKNDKGSPSPEKVRESSPYYH